MDKNITLTAQRMHAQGTITYGTPVGADYAVGSITYGAPDVGDTVVVDGNTFTCVAAAPGAGEFSSISELEALVEAVTGVNSSQNGTVVAITAAARGVAGNAITLALGVGNTGTMAISGATLTGGVDGDTVVVNGTTCTCVVGTAGANEFSNITELEVLVEAIAAINSSAASGVITINADAIGTGGNAITLALGEDNAGTMAISGATLTGGAAAIYTDAFDLPEGYDSYEVVINVSALGGGSPTVDCTPEGSVDGGVSYQSAEGDDENALTMTQLTAAGVDKQIVKNASPRNRLKIVLGGTSPTITARVTFIARND